MTKKQYSTRKLSVGTMKKSKPAITLRRFWRNVSSPALHLRLVGLSLQPLQKRDTVGSETSIAPQDGFSDFMR